MVFQIFLDKFKVGFGYRNALVAIGNVLLVYRIKLCHVGKERTVYTLEFFSWQPFFQLFEVAQGSDVRPALKMETDVVFVAVNKQNIIYRDSYAFVISFYHQKTVALDRVVVIVLHVAFEDFLA